jgi:hypothetical protein
MPNLNKVIADLMVIGKTIKSEELEFSNNDEKLIVIHMGKDFKQKISPIITKFSSDKEGKITLSELVDIIDFLNTYDVILHKFMQKSKIKPNEQQEENVYKESELELEILKSVA